ncbi:MAG: TIGR01212 family radical SAM protein [Muribaculaceae bacterium]|nr:TIGR01212 family radical SAM protein [Muribaculaceae bacterium]
MKTYAQFLQEHFSGKIQKLPIDTRRLCPNRDGTLSTDGCAYCLNASFSPDTAKAALPPSEQISRAKRFFAGKYKSMRYLAYFQSYTPTHAPIPVVLADVEEAMKDPEIAGVVLSTRPDCLPPALLEALASLPKPVHIEIGAETSFDRTLTRINRCHTWAQVVDAANRCAANGLPVGLHLIMGLPGETEEMMLETIRKVNALPVSTLKIHHLQILKGTSLGAAYLRGENLDIITFTPQTYAALCRRILSLLRPDIAVERLLAQAPPSLLLSPRWNLKPDRFFALL